MQAVRVHPAPASSFPYSPSNPAPPSALRLDENVPIPKPSKQGEVLIRVKATSVVRDALTWPETYFTEYAILGHDFAGVVLEAFPGHNGDGDSSIEPGSEVFGMTHINRPSTWAEYAVVKPDEMARKPRNMTWEQAAAMPLCALTAYEALFGQAEVAVPSFTDVVKHRTEQTSSDLDLDKPTVLITGAAGGVGIYLVQLGAIAGLHIVAATSSNTRNGTFLRGLGANEAVEYTTLRGQAGIYDIIIDTVGGNVLEDCWSLVKETGTLISVDSSSFQFVDKHKERGLQRGKERVKALFFIVSPSSRALEALANFADLGVLQPFVAETYQLARAKEAYERTSVKSPGHGKVILTV